MSLERTVRGRGLEQAGGLHREGRPAGHHVARAKQLGGRPGQSDRIDAGMMPETVVFYRDQQVGEERQGGFRAETPNATGGGEKCQRAVHAVEDFTADWGKAREVRREDVVEQGDEGSDREAERWQSSQEGEDDTPPPFAGGGWGEGALRSGCRPLLPTSSRKGKGGSLSGLAACAHSAATMVIRVAAWRANTAGRYMSATSAPGSSNVPGVTARTRTASRKFGFSPVSATTAA